MLPALPGMTEAGSGSRGSKRLHLGTTPWPNHAKDNLQQLDSFERVIGLQIEASDNFS